MRALVWQGKENVQVDTVPDPQVQDPRDIVIHGCELPQLNRGGKNNL